MHLAAEAPFAGAFGVVGLGCLPFDRFRSIDRIGKVNMPLWIIHGDRDRIIPQSHGRKLFKKAKAPKWFWSVPGAGHNTIGQTAGEEYWTRWREFLKSTAPQPAQGTSDRKSRWNGTFRS